MFTKEEMTASPLSVIRSLYDADSSILHHLENVSSYFSKELNNDFSQIPCINDVPLETIKPSSLVRFRGMVQDMFDPEFYLGKYECTDKVTKEKRYELGCFTDTSDSQGAIDINFEGKENITLDRQTFYCVPIPGENQWLKDLYKTGCNITEKNEASPQSKKRPYNEMEEMDSTDVANNTISTMECTEESNASPDKKVKAANGEEEGKKTCPPKIDFTKNYPLPDEKGPSCFIKMYSNSNDFKVNEVAEFICILSVDPLFAAPSLEKTVIENDICDAPLNTVEDEAHCPPPSLVPRLHCVCFKKIQPSESLKQINQIPYENACKELSTIRSEMMQLVTTMFGGDFVVAEYFILYLISSVYGRVGAMCVGKLTLNITNCTNDVFTKSLYEFVANIVEKSYFFPLTLDNLNNQRCIPRKDFDANRLVSGMLQLAEGTHLVLDETKLQPGKLDSDGVHNLTAIGNLIQWQKVAYDFKFSKVEMQSNVNVLVLSQAKSLLTCDCRIPIKPDEELKCNITSELSSKLIEKIRLYIAITRNIEYKLTDEIQKALEDDFVEMRKEDSKNINAESFYLLLTTARYMALSYGQETLSAPLWVKTKELDHERRKRMGVNEKETAKS